MKTTILLDSVSADGGSKPLSCAGYKNYTATINTTGGADARINFVGGYDKVPDFDSPQSVDNDWYGISGIDVTTGEPITYPTGVKASGGDIHKAVMLNVEGLRWVGAIVSDYVGGEITVKLLSLEPSA